MLKHMVFIVLLLPLSTAFADEYDVGGYIGEGLDFVGSIGKGAIDNSDLSDDSKGKLDSVISEGVPVAKSFLDSWIGLHHFIVNQVFNNTPIPIDVGIISLVSLGLIAFGIFHFIKKTFKLFVILALIAVAIFFFLVVLGIDVSI